MTGFKDMTGVPEFLAHAITLEQEAAVRFDELAGMLEVHNNHKGVVDLFRKMAHFSRLHLAEAKERAEGVDVPKLAPWEFKWPGDESPESGTIEDAHYLMTAHHALTLALASETRGYDFYQGLADKAADAQVREMAQEFADEEADHVATLKEWLTRYPEPESTWNEDMDPPVSVD
ncbi:ferritin-like domain-containing protein [Caenispirillum bisanense]|uniref:Rubrerythrin n=1 Tax=Caenispirillum bisanense TaxID=414052 RepID=A0A286G6E4_9PROT|nr:ferritin family protein [Caenispirillum bisanense]SOD91052.1 Rubrerythrin [Caenispirillum bisanense]